MLNYIDKVYSLDEIKTIEITYSLSPLLKANIYLPPQVKERSPVMVSFPAGGSDKDGFQTVNWAKEECARRGIIGVSGDVKIGKGNFDTVSQLETTSNAFALYRWLRMHKDEYNMSGKDIFAHGHSAGGLTAVQSGISFIQIRDRYLGDYDAFFGKVKYNTANMFDENGEKNRIAIKASIAISAPAGSYFNKLIIPSSVLNFEFHGALDETFPVEEAYKTYEAYLAQGVPSELTVYKDTDHNIGHADDIIADIFPKLAALITNK